MPINELFNLSHLWTLGGLDYFWSTILIVLMPVSVVLIFFLLSVVALTVVSYLANRKSYAKTFIELAFPSDNAKSTFATEQLYILLHTRSKSQNISERLLGRKKLYSFEIVSTKTDGIRYIISIPKIEVEAFQRSLRSFIPEIKIREIEDYIPSRIAQSTQVVEFKLASDFILPLNYQRALTEHDPMSYLTGHMTKLAPNELVAFQLILTPAIQSMHRVVLQRVNRIKRRIAKQLPLTQEIKKQVTYIPKPLQVALTAFIWLAEIALKIIVSLPSLLFDPNNKNIPIFQTHENEQLTDTANPYEKELGETIKSKLDQHLFEVSMRVLVIADTKQSAKYRADELLSAFRQFAGSQQSLVARKNYLTTTRDRLHQYKSRLISQRLFAQNPILSSSELANIYHLPHTKITRTEDLLKSKSQELPAPLTLKNNPNLDVIFGINTYGNSYTDIGLSDEDRSRHVYLLGQTGSGKSTVMYHTAKDDIKKGRGLALIDPHGDLAEDLLARVPDERINDLIYFNPFDIKYPVGINLLELTPDLSEDELELEKELVCESIISIFRRVFNKDENVDAHRIEYILRNTIHTAFIVPDATIFTVYELLNNPPFQKQITKRLTDENLQQFWRHEFGKAGNYQIVKMVGGVTAKVGRFLFSPTAKRILEQPKSTISFDDILDNGKILLCNLAEGKLGEDTSQLLGTMIIAKIHQAALRRARKDFTARQPFYLFIDEFQNFASSSFTKLLSGGRKFGLRIMIAEQSTAQQSDRNITNVILANTGTIICFRTASPVDEALMLAQFAPLIRPGDIGNLPRYRFYMRLAAAEPSDPFSGATLPMNTPKDELQKDRLVKASRSNYAIVYQKPEPKEAAAETKPKLQKVAKPAPRSRQKSGEKKKDIGLDKVSAS